MKKEILEPGQELKITSFDGFNNTRFMLDGKSYIATVTDEDSDAMIQLTTLKNDKTYNYQKFNTKVTYCDKYDWTKKKYNTAVVECN
jgi:hypothetical protein